MQLQVPAERLRTISSALGGCAFCWRSPITRMLLAGTHTAIVAKCHDTSEAMIRRHYAASILDFTDEMTRKTLPSFGPAKPTASNVVPLAKR
jgi:hypothetical protein